MPVLSAEDLRLLDALRRAEAVHAASRTAGAVVAHPERYQNPVGVDGEGRPFVGLWQDDLPPKGAAK